MATSNWSAIPLSQLAAIKGLDPQLVKLFQVYGNVNAGQAAQALANTATLPAQFEAVWPGSQAWWAQASPAQRLAATQAYFQDPISFQDPIGTTAPVDWSVTKLSQLAKVAGLDPSLAALFNSYGDVDAGQAAQALANTPTLPAQFETIWPGSQAWWKAATPAQRLAATQAYFKNPVSFQDPAKTPGQPPSPPGTPGTPPPPGGSIPGTIAGVPSDLGTWTMPGDTSARIAQLQGLQGAGATGLQSLMASGATDLPTNTKDVYDAIVKSSLENLQNQRTDLQRGLEEGTFSRGVGLSSISLDAMDRLNRDYADAGARATRDATAEAYNQARSNYQARLAGASQGFSSGTSGLQNEENIGMTNAARLQQGAQFATTQANTLSEAEKNRQQQKGLQEQAFSHADDIARAQLIAAGGSGLANLFGPAAKVFAEKFLA